MGGPDLHGINVNSDQLFDFSTKVASYQQTAQTGLTQPFSVMGEAKVGAVGTPEATSMRFHYTQQLEQVGQLVKDAMVGLGALQMGSFTVATNYITSDINSNNQMATVDAAFDPPAGKPSLSSMLAGQQQSNPKLDNTSVKPVNLPSPTGESAPPGSYRAPAPSAQTQAFQDVMAQQKKEMDQGGDTHKYNGYSESEIRQMADDGVPWAKEYLANSQKFIDNPQSYNDWASAGTQQTEYAGGL